MDALKVYLAEEDGVCAVCLVDIIADEDMVVDIGDAIVHRSCASAEGYELEEGGEDEPQEDDIAAEREEAEESRSTDDL